MPFRVRNLCSQGLFHQPTSVGALSRLENHPRMEREKYAEQRAPKGISNFTANCNTTDVQQMHLRKKKKLKLIKVKDGSQKQAGRPVFHYYIRLCLQTFPLMSLSKYQLPLSLLLPSKRLYYPLQQGGSLIHNTKTIREAPPRPKRPRVSRFFSDTRRSANLTHVPPSRKLRRREKNRAPT